MKFGENHLSYCTNVHPAESFTELCQMLSSDVPKIKSLNDWQRPMGVGLRLGAKMVQGLTTQHIDQINRILTEHDLYVFTVNAFPYGEFQAKSVKELVYEPGWHEVERLEYTKAVAQCLVRLNGPRRLTISTVGLGHKHLFVQEKLRNEGIQNLVRIAKYLEALHQKTGKEVQLCLEPEPGTALEYTTDVIKLFDELNSQLDDKQRKHLGVCYDTCHQAIMFENPVESLRALVTAEVGIGKMQLSNALAVKTPDLASSWNALMEFDEPRFLHQLTSNNPWHFAMDLDEGRQNASRFRSADELRCHFHVPIDWHGHQSLSSTTQHWRDAFAFALEHRICQHYEIETYTWSVLPAALVSEGIHAGIAREFNAAREIIQGI